MTSTTPNDPNVIFKKTQDFSRGNQQSSNFSLTRNIISKISTTISIRKNDKRKKYILKVRSPMEDQKKKINETINNSTLRPHLLSTTLIHLITCQNNKSSSIKAQNVLSSIDDGYEKFVLNPFSSKIASYRIQQLYDNYRPDVGLRTALILGSMFSFIVLYLLWKNRCRCLFKRIGSSSSDDCDMEYWLNYVDKQKLAQKNNMMNFNLQLPDIRTDSRETCAEWIVQHQKIWSYMHRIKDYAFSDLNNNIDFVQVDQTEALLNPELNLDSIFMKNKAENKTLKKFFSHPLKIFGFKKQTNLQRMMNRSANSILFFKSYKKSKSQMLEDLNTRNQLLIDCARLNALSKTKFIKTIAKHPSDLSAIVSTNCLGNFFILKMS